MTDSSPLWRVVARVARRAPTVQGRASSRALRATAIGAMALVAFQGSAEATVSGTNGPISFERIATCSTNIGLSAPQIFTINPDGSGLTNRSTSVCAGYSDGNPAVSPNGSKIAFVRSPVDGLSQIFVMNADGSNQTRLSNGIFNDSGPLAWSPSGAKIAFIRSDSIWTMNADGSNAVEVPNTSGDLYDGIAWSPDGTRLAFSTYQSSDNELDIYTISPTGSNLSNLTYGSGYDSYGATDWSPDGTKILTTRTTDSCGGYSDIWTINANGSGAADLTCGDSHYKSRAVWSPDGSKIAFDRSGTIYTMSASGTAMTALATGDNPSWGAPVPNPPSVAAPGVPQYKFYTPSALSTGTSPTVPQLTTWAASPTAGVTYTLQEQVNGGAWTTVLFGTTALQFKTNLAFNSTYAFRVKAVKNGISSGYATNSTFTVRPYQETALAYTGTWTASTNTSLWGGGGRYTKAAGASAMLSFTGRNVALIGNKGTGNGSAKMYIDGVLKSTVSEYATATKYRQLIAKAGWSVPGTHTIKFVNVATSGHPRFDVDGIVVFQ